MMYFKSQLAEVEKSLKEDPENEDFLQLKRDLEEGLALVADLQQASLASKNAEREKTYASESNDPQNSVIQSLWTVDDICMANSSSTDTLIPAQIISIDDQDKTCIVKFLNTDDSEELFLTQLKPLRHAEKEAISSGKYFKKSNNIGGNSNKNSTGPTKKEERKRIAKEHKEIMRAEVSNWKKFKTKYASKMKGQIKQKSIFESPESVSGHIGHGTAGTADKPMSQIKPRERNRF